MNWWIECRWFLKLTLFTCASEQSMRQQLLFIENVCNTFLLSDMICHFIFKKSRFGVNLHKWSAHCLEILGTHKIPSIYSNTTWVVLHNKLWIILTEVSGWVLRNPFLSRQCKVSVKDFSWVMGIILANTHVNAVTPNVYQVFIYIFVQHTTITECTYSKFNIKTMLDQWTQKCT